MTEVDFASTTVGPKEAVASGFDRLVGRLIPQTAGVEQIARVAVGLNVAANHLVAMGQRQEPKE